MGEDDRPFPPPLGAPLGPSMPTPALVAAYLEGAAHGSSPEAHIEEPVLLAHDHPLAARVGRVVLVRDEPPPVACEVHAVLRAALEAAGAGLVEPASVLAGAVALELAVPRGYEWSLWAPDADVARDELVRCGLAEFAGFIEADASRQRARAEVDATLEEIEQGLWGQEPR